MADSETHCLENDWLVHKYLLADTIPPEIEMLSPKSQIYPATVWYCGLDAFQLIFTVNEPVVWIGYSLDGENNVTYKVM